MPQPPARARVARNEAVFREVNERIREVTAHWASEDAAAFVCECSRADCVETLTLTVNEYESVRADPRWFVVAPDHVDLRVERVVREDGARFVVVEKSVDLEFFVATDPRE